MGNVRRHKKIGLFLLGMLLWLGCTACAGSASASDLPELTQEAVEEGRSLVDIRLPEASGVTVFSQGGFDVDASNVQDGYVMVRGEETDRRIKVSVSLGDEQYYYNLPTDGQWVTLPLQMGSGTYTVRVLEQVEGSRYAQVLSAGVSVSLKDEQTPFTYPGLYVDYDRETDAVAWSFVLCRDLGGDGEKMDILYQYVIENIRYDTQKARTVQSGYVPVMDETLWSGQGICFDTASLFTGMLRAQGIPTRLVFGYISPGDEYHAWSQIWLDGEWVFRDATLGSASSKKEYSPTGDY